MVVETDLESRYCNIMGVRIHVAAGREGWGFGVGRNPGCRLRKKLSFLYARGNEVGFESRGLDATRFRTTDGDSGVDPVYRTLILPIPVYTGGGTLYRDKSDPPGNLN